MTSLWSTSIKYRLMLLFFTITAGAILVIYFYVVPQLESNLTSQKIDGLKRDAATYSEPLERVMAGDVPKMRLDSLTRQIAEQTDSGVTLLGVPMNELDPTRPAPPYVISDSREARRKIEPSSENVLTAARERKVETTTTSEGGRRLAQAAKPLIYRGQAFWVVVFSEPLDDVADNVALIRRQILIAGVIALLVALISGYYAASALSRRVKRLERAAGEVAAGNFSEPIAVDSEDELGQLARAFNEMQRRLARLDEARKEFIANASHELRTPIFSLGGFVELLQDEEIDESTRNEFLATMREQVDRLQKLTTELLDLSRLDAGSLELEREPVPLRTLGGQVAGEFAAAAARQDAQIYFAGDETDPEVEALCDPERVAQILRALLDNALTHAGGPATIEVSAHRGEPGPGRPAEALLTVTDNGPGIDRRDLPHVFDRFHTGNTAQGSGLGLAIARELAERMLGRLVVSSQPGKTEFKLALPLAPDEPSLDGGERSVAGVGVKSSLLGLGLVLVALALPLAGCGGDGDGSSSESHTETTKVQVVEGTGADGSFDPAGIFRRLSNGVVTVVSLFGKTQDLQAVLSGEGSAGQGSGFVLDDRGFVATNAHVITEGRGKNIKKAREVYVQFADGNQVAAKIVGFDANSDVGLIKVDPKGLELVPLGFGKSDGARVGEPVAAIGSPFGEEQSLSVGVVSATDRSIEALTDFQIGDAIQTDAAINRGNSGGPLLNAKGEVLGINSQIRSASGGSEGVGFAVPSETVKRSIDQLRSNGEVRYAFLGVSSQSLYPQLAKHLGLPVEQGALVVEVVKDGPADKAGIKGGNKETRFQTTVVKQGGDVITKVNGEQVSAKRDIAELIAGLEPGDTVTLEVYRGGKRREVEVKLGERPSDLPS